MTSPTVFDDYSRLAASVHIARQIFPYCLRRTENRKAALMAVLDVAQLLFALHLDPNPPVPLEESMDMQNLFGWQKSQEEWVQLLEMARNHVENN